MKAHDLLRSLHEDTPPMMRDNVLETEAQAHAEHLMALKRAPEEKDHDERNNDNGWGENIGYGYTYWRYKHCAEIVYNW